MQADTTFATDLLTYGHVVPNLKIMQVHFWMSSGGSNAPNLVPNATPTPQTGSLSLVAEQTSAPVVFLTVEFGDLAVSALIDSRAMHDFLADSLLPKLRD